MYKDGCGSIRNFLQLDCGRVSVMEREVYEFCDKYEMLVGQNRALEVKSIKSCVFHTFVHMEQERFA